MRDEGGVNVDAEIRVQQTPDLCTMLIDSLEQRWRKYLKELRLCKKTTPEESVHNVRVATRRLIATLAIIELVLPCERVRRMRGGLKRLFDSFSLLRDTQVQLMMLERDSIEHPELETLLTVLRIRERNLTKTVTDRVKRIETSLLSRTVRAVKTALRLHFSRPIMRETGMAAVMGVIASRFMRAALCKVQVIATQTKTMHRARIAFKKFRYTVEAILPLFPELTSEQLKAMDAYQTRLGNVQDAETLQVVVRRFAQKRNLSSRKKLSAYQRELVLRKRELVTTYMQSADEVYRFWQSSITPPSMR